MKNLCIHYVLRLILMVSPLSTIAQAKQTETLEFGTIPAYSIEVTYDKTSHIIFPSGIRYVDLGSDYIVADKAADAENVLRVKASVKEFTEETNFSVITEDGQFYGFNVCYSNLPAEMSYNLATAGRAVSRKHSADVQFEELGSPASLTGLLMETLYRNNKKEIRNIKSDSYGMTFRLKGIYVHQGKYYFHIELENDTYVPFETDFITFTIADRKVAKRTVMQQKALDPLRSYRPLLPVHGQTTERNIYLLDVFTLSEGQVLLIEAYEKNGDRSQVLKVKNSDLVRAKPLEKLKLKL
ncbi:conjugative transposon protein TraN [Flavobacterium rakeshii]|uniref:conjugative transposon protein TraN n=1 Tax=Flavobacterium rakeshii TaxID=1038845 RepID=UPI002E7BE7B9|nr:conjugative transposon protein TraN [Flavobacterium rakeshii]MEE1897024.1 conjugative transposon protein TraN [Flavobacterium rakeshii]